MNITQDRAICMLFYKEFSEENVKQCKQDISSLSGKFQVCYQTSPNEPILVSEFRIFGEPAGDYHLYPEVATAEHQEAIVREECNTCKERQQESPDDVISVNVTETLEEEDPSKPILVSKLRILGDPINFHTYPEVLGNTQTDTGKASSLVDNVVPQRDQEKQVQPDVNVLNDDDSTFEDVQTRAFINKVFLAKEPENDDLYYQLSCTVKNIFHVIKKYTMFEDSSLFAFQNWCLQQDLHFWKAQKSNTSNEEKLLILFKLKMEYFDEALEAATKEAAKICRA
ncbi:hypothetical protein MUCCIDRAFT_114756 [Mucor lusitanicus CBS 277.49]|uniref:Uncharacterized protein n=1 Tax=Mucor lusitanicus CBS 277.49 TaxID=747725 RepID=A0A168I548_MUCCL|nr:hypothetical protein MUCCIDRAFT_114756 [Mucor lusitanicus CBS 277.49]